MKETHMRLNIDDAYPSSFQHLINSIGADPVQVALILPILHKPEPTSTHMTHQRTANGTKSERKMSKVHF